MNMFLGGALFIVFFLSLGVSTALTPAPATPTDDMNGGSG
jgi:hypothetical protein